MSTGIDPSPDGRRCWRCKQRRPASAFPGPQSTVCGDCLLAEGRCPECGCRLRREGRCRVCRCGYTSCGG